MTIVLTTHYMEEAQYLCDRILLLKQGKKVIDCLLYTSMDKGLNVEQTEQKIKSKIEPKKPKAKTKSISQNLKIAMNTIQQAIQMVEQAGVEVIADTQELEDEVIYTCLLYTSRCV